MTRGYAFFDLDHTILPHDTQSLFCNFVLRREGWRRVYLLSFAGFLILGGLRLIPLATMKRAFFGFLRGMAKERIAELVKEFVATDFLDSVYPAVVAEIERHRREGRLLVLNSASPTFYLDVIGKQLGFDEVFGTPLVIEPHQPWLPRLAGPNNKRGAKIDAMRERGLIDPDMPLLPDSWAYSDSPADLPLLELAEHPVMIHPGRRLAAHGWDEGWRTMTPAQPYAGTWGDRLATVQQVLGLYRVRKVTGIDNPFAEAGKSE
jgi:HAD superfamily hydrolase (TIGR01490 family)